MAESGSVVWWFCLVHTADMDKTKLSCPCLLCVGGVNKIGYKSRLSATVNFETVLSSLEMRWGLLKKSWLVAPILLTPPTRQDKTVLSCPCRWCDLAIRILDSLLGVVGSIPCHDIPEMWPSSAGKLSGGITTTQINSALHPLGVIKYSTILAGLIAGKSPLPYGRYHCVIQYGVLFLKCFIRNSYIRFTYFARRKRYRSETWRSTVRENLPHRCQNMWGWIDIGIW